MPCLNRLYVILFTLTHILLGVDPVSADRLKAGDDENVDDSKRQCGLYYAPSSIKEAGWGVFAGKNIRENSIVGGSSPAILLFDVDRYHGNALQNTILTDYFWMADWANQKYEALYVEGIVPGVGKQNKNRDLHESL